MRLFLLIIPILVLAGCGFRLPQDATHPAATITVFSDGFHSGFIVPYEDLPFSLSTAGGQLPPFVEVGFSEWRWAMNLDRSNAHALRLLFVSSPGVVMVSYLADERRNADALVPRLAFAIPLDAQQKTDFYEELLAWIDPRKPALYTTTEQRPTHFLASRERYALLANCHDFTAHMLRVIGIPVPWTVARTPGRFAWELCHLVVDARAAGWPIVSMTPTVIHVDAPAEGTP
jgi:hypothetical protein